MSEPIETIYKAITYYRRMCTSAKVPSTDLQLIGVGLFIFNKSNLMTKFVTKWEKKYLVMRFDLLKITNPTPMSWRSVDGTFADVHILS